MILWALKHILSVDFWFAPRNSPKDVRASKMECTNCGLTIPDWSVCFCWFHSQNISVFHDILVLVSVFSHFLFFFSMEFKYLMKIYLHQIHLIATLALTVYLIATLALSISHLIATLTLTVYPISCHFSTQNISHLNLHVNSIQINKAITFLSSVNESKHLWYFDNFFLVTSTNGADFNHNFLMSAWWESFSKVHFCCRSTECTECNTKFPVCIVTGRSILENQYWMCSQCKHRAMSSEIKHRKTCPLCHKSVW